jgi:Ca-activated chloride channel family protein
MTDANDATQLSAPAGDATIIAPGVGQGDATVVATAQGDATVVVAGGGGAPGQAQRVDLAALKPTVEYQLRAHNTYALSGQHSQNYLLADIKAFFGGGLAGARSPVALALAIDRSGSMEGKPIEAVKTAVGAIIDQLTPDDVLSIVTFSEHVDVLMPASRVVDGNVVKQHVNRIRPKGVTNLHGGMATAAEQLLNANMPEHLSRVIVLTDGEANEGIVEYHDIISTVRGLRSRGATISTVGLGIEYNEELMTGIAKNGRGNYYYIDTIDQIAPVFDAELKSIFGTVATNVVLRLEFPEGVELAQVYGFECDSGPRRAVVDLPDLGNGETLPVLAQLKVKPHPRARFRVVKSELGFRYFGQQERRTLKGEMVVEFSQDKDAILGGVDPVVDAEMREKDIVVNLKRAAQLMGSDVGTATMLIQQAQAQLSASGKEEDATMVGTALGKLQRGAVDDATKTLSQAEFGLELGKEHRE